MKTSKMLRINQNDLSQNSQNGKNGGVKLLKIN